MTDRQKEAMTILLEVPGITARFFAKRFWPDNDMHLRPKNGGNGSQKGKGAWLAAGSYMGKLIKKGMVRHTRNYGYELTAQGIKELKEEICKDNEKGLSEWVHLSTQNKGNANA